MENGLIKKDMVTWIALIVSFHVCMINCKISEEIDLDRIISLKYKISHPDGGGETFVAKKPQGHVVVENASQQTAVIQKPQGYEYPEKEKGQLAPVVLKPQGYVGLEKVKVQLATTIHNKTQGHVHVEKKKGHLNLPHYLCDNNECAENCTGKDKGNCHVKCWCKNKEFTYVSHTIPANCKPVKPVKCQMENVCVGSKCDNVCSPSKCGMLTLQYGKMRKTICAPKVNYSEKCRSIT